MKRCRVCRFFDSITEGFGLCRRYAPKPDIILRKYGKAPWPEVCPDDWCGDWEKYQENEEE